MEEIEVPLEKVQEGIHETAAHSGNKLMMRIALSSAFLAALAAIAALLAGHHANEAMLEQIRASDQWNLYQAKGIKAAVLAAKLDLISAIGHEPLMARAEEREKISDYKREQEEIKKDAEEKEAESRGHMEHHVVLARAVTMFQVAISIAAISALTRRRRFWLVSMGFGLLGSAFLIQGFLLH